MATTIKCEVCDRSFRVYGKRDSTARFCSNVCRGKWMSTCHGADTPHWQGNLIMLICEYCGQSYQRGQAIAKNSHFCSRGCCDKGKTQRSHVEITCEQCGQLFQCPKSYAQGRRFCSGCYQTWLKKHARKPFMCEQCGKVFLRQPNQAGTARFCSRGCLAKSRVGSKAANWQGGKSFEPYPLVFNRKFKQRVRERDGNLCAICRLFGNCVHHIDYDKENTKMENCITLCTTCHGVTNTNRGYWQGALVQLMDTHEVGKAETEDPNWPV